MVDGSHDGERSSHGPDAAADAVEDLAHDAIADVHARMVEVYQQSTPKDAERNARGSWPVVTTVGSQTPADERSNDSGGHREGVEDVAGFGDAELVDDSLVGVVVRVSCARGEG